jgi:hypothetical protein
MNYIALTLLTSLIATSPLAAETAIEKTTKELGALPATTVIADKLTKVTTAYAQIKAASAEVAALVAAGNKLIFDNKDAASLAMQDQDLIKAPAYAAYKAAAEKINTLITTGTKAIIWN